MMHAAACSRCVGAQLMLGSPRDFTDFVEAEMTRWRGVITKANIKISD